MRQGNSPSGQPDQSQSQGANGSPPKAPEAQTQEGKTAEDPILRRVEILKSWGQFDKSSDFSVERLALSLRVLRELGERCSARGAKQPLNGFDVACIEAVCTEAVGVLRDCIEDPGFYRGRSDACAILGDAIALTMARYLPLERARQRVHEVVSLVMRGLSLPPMEGCKDISLVITNNQNLSSKARFGLWGLLTAEHVIQAREGEPPRDVFAEFERAKAACEMVPLVTSTVFSLLIERTNQHEALKNRDTLVTTLLVESVHLAATAALLRENPRQEAKQHLQSAFNALRRVAAYSHKLTNSQFDRWSADCEQLALAYDRRGSEVQALKIWDSLVKIADERAQSAAAINSAHAKHSAVADKVHFLLRAVRHNFLRNNTPAVSHYQGRLRAAAIDLDPMELSEGKRSRFFSDMMFAYQVDARIHLDAAMSDLNRGSREESLKRAEAAIKEMRTRARFAQPDDKLLFAESLLWLADVQLGLSSRECARKTWEEASTIIAEQEGSEHQGALPALAECRALLAQLSTVLDDNEPLQSQQVALMSMIERINGALKREDLDPEERAYLAEALDKSNEVLSDIRRDLDSPS